MGWANINSRSSKGGERGDTSPETVHRGEVRVRVCGNRMQTPSVFMQSELFPEVRGMACGHLDSAPLTMFENFLFTMKSQKNKKTYNVSLSKLNKNLEKPWRLFKFTNSFL